MKAIVLNGPNDFSLQEVENPVPTADEVEIKVHMAGICGTDLHLLRGRNPFASYPIVPGHEYMGEVLRAPEKSTLKQGDKVTVYPGVGCGKCEACKAGHFPHCPEFKFIGVHLSGGCFAERVVADYKRVFLLPQDMDDEIGATVEPAAVGVHANRRAGIRGGERVVVIGGGTIGLLIAQVALAYGASKVILSEPVAERRVVAREVGLELICNPQEGDLVSFVQVNAGMADVVFDVVGSEKTLADAEDMLRPDGRLILIALPHTERQGVPYWSIFAKELKVIGSRTYFVEDFPEAIELLRTQRVNARRLISKILPLDRLPEGVDLLEKKPEEHVKILVSPLLPA
jgi:2-desacetyl-2-hydroxyethyl bacteriochlorophyllide A dehydrogenase